MPRKKTPKKTKLSPAEKKDRKRLSDRARQAKKREDPDVRDKENAQKRARREDPDVRDEENAKKRARRAEDGEYRDALQVRDLLCPSGAFSFFIVSACRSRVASSSSRGALAGAQRRLVRLEVGWRLRRQTAGTT